MEEFFILLTMCDCIPFLSYVILGTVTDMYSCLISFAFTPVAGVVSLWNWSNQFVVLYIAFCDWAFHLSCASISTPRYLKFSTSLIWVPLIMSGGLSSGILFLLSSWLSCVRLEACITTDLLISNGEL
jgi:hypothetical protein